jgi:quercetin dioxygenase-like cupin family protein
MSNLQELETLGPKLIWDEVSARIVQGDRITMAVVELSSSAGVPEHRHENEQIGLVIQGSVTITVGEETKWLGPGGTYRISSNTPHRLIVEEGGAVVVDVFSPPRADWDKVELEPARRPLWPPSL